MWGGNGLIKIRKIVSVVLYQETIQIPWFSFRIMAVNLVYENYHEQVPSLNLDNSQRF